MSMESVLVAYDEEFGDIFRLLDFVSSLNSGEILLDDVLLSVMAFVSNMTLSLLAKYCCGDCLDI